MKRLLLTLLAAGTVAVGSAVAAPAASAPSFPSEQLVGTLADDNWEPTVAVDPHAPWVYQAVTALNDQCVTHDCSIDSILVRASSNGGATWGPLVPVCGLPCKNVPWQFDPQLAVANDGTVYAAWLNTFNPGTVLARSVDHGRTWTTPVTIILQAQFDFPGTTMTDLATRTVATALDLYGKSAATTVRSAFQARGIL